MLIPLHVSSLWHSGRDFLFPPGCGWCGDPVPEGESSFQGDFCEECQLRLAPIQDRCCQRCSAPVGPFVQTETGCHYCAREKFSFSRAVSLGLYRGELRQACLLAKRSRSPQLAASLGDLLCRRAEDRLTSEQYDLVIPVPHHWVDRLRAHQHPADAVAERIGRFLMVPVVRHILLKIRWTRKQVSLPHGSRWRNVHSAFRIAKRTRLSGLRILLADDVLTTGATASCAALELLKAGATRVDVAVIARASDVLRSG